MQGAWCDARYNELLVPGPELPVLIVDVLLASGAAVGSFAAVCKPPGTEKEGVGVVEDIANTLC